MKKTILLICLTAASVNLSADENYTGSSFQDVWSEVESDQYPLPKYEVSLESLFFGSLDLITRAANRTLFVKSDILYKINGIDKDSVKEYDNDEDEEDDFDNEPGNKKYLNKLAHPNGICLSGKWKINKENPYSGYFKNGSEALIIARASTAMSATRAGENRAFGFAGKLFPTTNASQVVKTGNFFTVDNLGGTKAKHFTDVKLSNAPKVSLPGWSLLSYAIELAGVFKSVDQNPAERQMYEISELGESDLSKVITPKNFRISARPGQTKDFKDFRDELNVKNYNNNLVFDISVNTRSNRRLVWMKVGEITFNKSMVSKSCDRRLHFHHPRWKSKLEH